MLSYPYCSHCPYYPYYPWCPYSYVLILFVCRCCLEYHSYHSYHSFLPSSYPPLLLSSSPPLLLSSSPHLLLQFSFRYSQIHPKLQVTFNSLTHNLFFYLFIIIIIHAIIIFSTRRTFHLIPQTRYLHFMTIHLSPFFNTSIDLCFINTISNQTHLNS